MKRVVVWALAFGCLVFDPAALAADPKRVVLLAVALIVAVLGKRRAPKTYVKYTFMGFVLLTALSAAWGTSLSDLATFAAAALIATTIGSPANARATAMRVALLVGGVASLLALFAFAGGGHGFALHGGQGNPNWLGLLLAVTLPLSFDAVALAGAAGSKRPLLAALAAVQVPALFLAHSRVAWLAAGVSLLVAAAFAKRRLRSRRRLRGGRAAVLALGVGAMLTVAVMLRERPTAPTAKVIAAAHDSEDRAPEDVSAVRSLAGRAWIWRISAHAALDAPFFGAGLGRFPERYLAAQGDALRTLPPREASRRFVNATTAHDEPLQVATESGVLASLLLVLGLSALAVGHLRAGRAGFGAAALAVLVTSLGDSPLRQPAIALLVALLVAAETSRGARSPANPTMSLAAFPRLRPALAALVILGGGWLLSEATRGWLATHLATTASELVDAHDRDRRLARASRIDPSSGEILFDRGTNALAMGDAALALTYFEASRPRFANVGTFSAMGEAALALGDANRARDAWTAALALHPGSARAHLGLAEAEHRLDHDDLAEASLHVAKLLLPGDPRVAAMEDRLAEARGDRERP